MTSAIIDETPESPPELPAGAHIVFLVLCGVAFIALMTGLVGYGVFGETITAGLDNACAEAALVAGRKLEAMGNTTQAVQKYRQALSGHIADEQERLRCGLAIGDLLYRDKRYNEALAAYRELPEAAFATSGAYAGYAGTLWQLGDVEEALRLSEPWLARAMEEGNQEQEIWARKMRMRAADDRGDEAAMLAECRRIVELEPGNDAALTLAASLQRGGDIDGARRHATTFLEATTNPALKKSARAFLDRLAAPVVPPQP